MFYKFKKIFIVLSDRYYFFLILTWGTLLRFFKAFIFQGLDQDEASTYWTSVNNTYSNHFVRNNYDEHAHPPLAYLFQKTWSEIFDNEISLRIPSFFLSVLCIYWVLQISIKLFKNNKFLKYLVPFYFSSSSFFIFFGVIYRTYSVVFFFSIWLVYIFVQLCNGAQRKPIKLFVLFILLIFLSLMSDYSSFWVVLSIGVFLFIQFFKKNKILEIKKIFISWLVGIAFYLPWIVSMFWKNFQLALIAKREDIFPFENFLDFVSVIVNFFDFKYVVYQHQNYLILFAIIFILTLVGMLVNVKKQCPYAFFLCLSVIVPFSVSAVFSVYISPVFDYKNLWFPIFCLCTYGLILLSSMLNKKAKVLFVILFIVFQLATLKMTLLNYAHAGYVRGELRYYNSSPVKDALNYIKTTERLNHVAIIYPREGEWSATVWLYRHWIKGHDTMTLYPIIDFKHLPNIDQDFYYYDLDRDSVSIKRLNAVEEKFNCRVEDLNHIVRQGAFKVCRFQK